MGRPVQATLWEDPDGRWVIHVDMDAFFASVEQHDDPALQGQPVVVCNSTMPLEKLQELAREALDGPPAEFIRGVRGVVASASYEARAFGVRSAMPLARALALCPRAVVLAGRFDRYHEVAHHLRQIWSEFSPLVEPVSVDEAYLDMTGSELERMPIEGIAGRLKTRIKSETGLTASVGVASSKLMAKIASDLDKPDGLVVIPHGEEADALAPLPVRALPGVGPRTAEVLQSLDIRTLGQLAAAPYDVLARTFGADHAGSLLRRAVGIDSSPVQVPGDPKSVSTETTLVEDSCDLAVLSEQLQELAGRVASTLKRDGLMARCIYIKLRLLPARRTRQPGDPGFGKLITRQVSTPAPTNASHELTAAATRLLETAARDTGILAGSQVVRLLGVGAASLFRVEEGVRKT
jgi:DNA polymerase-4